MVQSKALEVNLASYHVDVDIDPKYAPLQAVMSQYYGLTDGLTVFLKELSHPYRNWQFIVNDARGYALDYFHLLKTHSEGPEAVALFADIFHQAVTSAKDPLVVADAGDNLLLFLQKAVTDAGDAFHAFWPALAEAFRRIAGVDDAPFFLFVKSYYQIRRLGTHVHDAAPEDIADFSAVNALLARYFQATYDYWLSEEDPWEWFTAEAGDINGSDALKSCFADVTHAAVRDCRKRLTEILDGADMKSRETLAALIALPGFNQFVEKYRKIPAQLLSEGEQSGLGNRWKVIFLFHIMNASGLSSIHEEVLRDINRTLSWLISHENNREIVKLIHKTFSILKTRTDRYPTTALNSILNMGKGVYKTDDHDLVNYFIDSVIDLGFQAPMIGGVGNDWQIIVNNAHILNIRTWLELIELNPKWSTRMISYLIIHISLCGVFIKDTDLFPRDITRLLNSEISHVYNLVKQLTRLLPAFFNDIGAEGALREISTRIDEITHRKDELVHFLRKQSHVESSNRIIGFMEAVLNFWRTRDKSGLEPFVPPAIYEGVRAEGPYVDGVHRAMTELENRGLDLPDDLLRFNDAQVSALLRQAKDIPEADAERVQLAIALYKLLNQKYNIDFIELNQYISQLKAEAFPDLHKLKQALEEKSLKKKVGKLLDYLAKLKNIILSDKVYEVREDIYKKRHFTIDIPSMYGSYHELKFDALGLTFRIESLVNVLFEELVENLDLSLITKATLYEIFARLRLFYRALQLDGMPSVEIERHLDLLASSLDVRGFSFTQYLDIFKEFVQAVNHIISDHFHNIHEQNLNRILSQIPLDHILPKYMPADAPPDRERLKHRISEIYFRDRIATSMALQQMDTFLSKILQTLFQQAEKLPGKKLHQLLLYDPEYVITTIENAGSGVHGLISLGNKGQNLARMKKFGMPVPPGFIITTEVFRFRDMIYSYPPAEQNFKEQLARKISEMERKTGNNFGDPANPLLFSVRSGSSISQPGMMDTFLNVGINQEIAEGIARVSGNAWFAWDNYRRFLQCWGMSTYLDRDDFDAIMNDFKSRWGIPLKRFFSGQQMKQVALAYKKKIEEAGVKILDNPFEQLYMAIKRVFRSWDSPKARTYRKIMGISEDWGTAVTVQKMVFGNASRQAGTGVIFTHNPRWSVDSIRLWGDFTLGNQGEDVVAGLVQTLPISISQQEIEKRNTDVTLESHFPNIYYELTQWAAGLIEEKGWSPQEMEFTFESPDASDLYLLQTRDMAMRERKKVLQFDPAELEDRAFLGHGIGVSGGAMSGRAVFDLEEIDKWRSGEPRTSLILLRGDTVPDDIKEIFAADGLLTARGGLTSHAAVVAHRLDKTCVVGCGNMIFKEKEKTALFNQVVIRPGDFISIDGQEGSVFQDAIRVI